MIPGHALTMRVKCAGNEAELLRYTARLAGYYRVHVTLSPPPSLPPHKTLSITIEASALLPLSLSLDTMLHDMLEQSLQT